MGRIVPGSTIGILGGGQLGKMLADAAREMGYRTMVLDPSPEGCAKLSCDEYLASSYGDEAALKKMAEECDVVTYEFENVPSETIDRLQEMGAYIPQGKKPLYITQHRMREKGAVNSLGIKTTDYEEVLSVTDLKTAIEKIGYPAILKTSTGGYDGKGQWVIRDEEGLSELIRNFKEGEYILEKMVKFQCELSCLAVRSTDGSTAAFPVGENIHKNGILHITIVPSRMDEEIRKRAEETALKIIEGLNFTGPLAIEFFLGEDNELYVNEMAPRPHNSTHYTMDGCSRSQFHLHIEAICGMKLEPPKLIRNSVMLNILGEDVPRIEGRKFDSETVLHMYGKTEAKTGRKMGHINLIGGDLEKLIIKAREI